VPYVCEVTLSNVSFQSIEEIGLTRACLTCCWQVYNHSCIRALCVL